MISPDDHTFIRQRRVEYITFDDSDDGPLKVLVLASDPLVRTGLASYFNDTADFTLAGSLAFDEHLDEVLRTFEPDVAVWDVSGTDQVVPDLQPLIDASVPVAALIPDENYVETAWLAGARALLLRTADQTLILTALFALHRGLIVIDPGFEESVLTLRQPEPDPADLTPREHEVLTLLAEGLPNKQIADRLDISEHTVKFHVAALMSKLGAQSRTEAVILAARRGMLIV